LNIPVDDNVLRLLAGAQVPGLSLCLMEAGEVRFSRTYGLRSAPDGQPVDAATPFQVASVTKSLNGLLFMTLARDGVVDLDSPVNPKLKNWRLDGDGADTVTPAMLLAHLGGTTVHGFLGYAPGEAIPNVEQILSGATPANSERVDVVRRPVYSGGGTTVLQKLASDVTATSYADLLHTRVLAPLGMSHSFIGSIPLAMATELALGHNGNGVLLPGGYRIHPELAAAGLWTTATDLARFIGGLFRSLDGEPDAILPRGLAQRMITPHVAGAGLGVFSEAPGIFGHLGANVGYRARYVADANTGRATIVMCNGDNGDAAITPLLLMSAVANQP
jgi:CubicO group peptidase (beta-lactamase class C family)